jgi:hypothetical protein
MLWQRDFLAVVPLPLALVTPKPQPVDYQSAGVLRRCQKLAYNEVRLQSAQCHAGDSRLAER